MNKKQIELYSKLKDLDFNNTEDKEKINNVLLSCILKDQYDNVRFLLLNETTQHFFDIDYDDCINLRMAGKNGNLEIIKFLIEDEGLIKKAELNYDFFSWVICGFVENKDNEKYRNCLDYLLNHVPQELAERTIDYVVYLTNKDDLKNIDKLFSFIKEKEIINLLGVNNDMDFKNSYFFYCMEEVEQEENIIYLLNGLNVEFNNQNWLEKLREENKPLDSFLQKIDLKKSLDDSLKNNGNTNKKIKL